MPLRIFPKAPLAFRRIGCYNGRVLLRILLTFALAASFIGAPASLLAQNNAVIDQARLFRDANAPARARGEASDTALPVDDDTATDDDSMGVQQILKEQEKRPTFAVTVGVSEVFTSNVALTRLDERHDLFGVAEVGVAWTPRLSPTVEANAGAHASIFRYVRTPELDFENLGVGAGLTWAPQNLGGVGFFARYDLTQLLDSDGGHILTDNVFTVGGQKVIAFSRAQSLTIGGSGSLSFSDPISAQRHQAGVFATYRVQVARDFGVDLVWRPAFHFYEELGRSDFNNIVSMNLRYRISTFADLSAFASYGINRSETIAFDYNVFTSGAGVVLALRF